MAPGPSNARPRDDRAPAAVAAPPQEPAWLARSGVAIAVLLGLALLAIECFAHRIGDYYTETDFYGGYAIGARLLQAGHFDASRYGVVGPGYELAVALIGALTRDLFAAGEAISVMSAMLTVVLWFTLVRRRSDGWTAIWTAALIAANPTFVRYGFSATTDALALALEAAVLFFAAGSRRPWAPFVAGVALACAVATRYTAVALLPVTLLLAVATPERTAARRARALAWHVAGLALVLVPWLLASRRAGHLPGELLFHDFAFDVLGTAQGHSLTDYQNSLQPGLHSLGDVVARGPLAILAREWSNLRSHVLADARDLMGWPLAAAAVLGMLEFASRRRRRALGTLLLAAALLYLSLVPAPSSARYSLVLLPFAALLAAVAATSPRLARIGPWAVATVLMLSAWRNLAAQRDVFALLPIEARECARALPRGEAAHTTILALKPNVAYEAGAHFAPMPLFQDLAALSAAARASGAEYLYVSWIEADNRPACWFLLDPAAGAAGLQVIHAATHHAAVLYRIGPGFGAEPAWLADTARVTAAEQDFIARMPPTLRGRAHLSLAVWARGMKRWADQRAHAEAAVADGAGSSPAWLLLGEARFTLGDREGAIVAFTNAIHTDPDNVDAHVALGWIHLGQDDAESAVADWAPVTTRTRNVPTLTRMMSLFAARGDTVHEAQARASLERQSH